MSNERLIARPNDARREQLVREIIRSKNLFRQATLAETKQILPWIDVITYEDMRHLLRDGKFTEPHIRDALVL